MSYTFGSQTARFGSKVSLKKEIPPRMATLKDGPEPCAGYAAIAQFLEKVLGGLLDAEFKLRRHESANAMTVVFGLSPRRSRVLHDATVLEIRRQLIDIVEVPPRTRANLIGTRGHALARYADQLSPEDFSRLAFLMRGLSPMAILKGPLDWVLNGHPEARPLHDCG
jgi:hypothetical protein